MITQLDRHLSYRRPPTVTTPSGITSTALMASAVYERTLETATEY